jgi:hypothetical protein
MNIDFEISHPIDGMTIQEIKHYRKIHYYMSNNKCLDKIINNDLTMFDSATDKKIHEQKKLQYLSKLFPESVRIYNEYKHIAPKPVHKKAVCVVGVKPLQCWSILSEYVLLGYDVFFICDKEFDEKDYVLMATDRKNIHYINLPKDIVVGMGYTDITHAYNANRVQSYLWGKTGKCAGWEKAIFYFSQINLNYEHIWMMEDDCILFTQKNMKTYDKYFDHIDWMSSVINPVMRPLKGWWFKSLNKWDKLPQYPKEEWSFGYVRCGRMSRRLMHNIFKHFEVYNRGFYAELFFGTICNANKLKKHPLFLNRRYNDKFQVHAFRDIKLNIIEFTSLTQYLIEKPIIQDTDGSLIYHHVKKPKLRMEYILKFLPMQLQWFNYSRMRELMMKKTQWINTKQSKQYIIVGL